MKRLATLRTLLLVFALLFGIIPVSATERPYAANGNGIATFITDGAGNVTGATVTVSGNATHLGLFTGSGTIQFLPFGSYQHGGPGERGRPQPGNPPVCA